MIIGKVIGTVVASRKEEELTGLKFLAVAPLDLKTGELKGGGVVAVDAVGAGVGEVVLYASGSSARQTTVTQRPPGGCHHHGHRRHPRGGRRLVIYQK
jgi:microcompartment protein CcmK/EutM